MRLTRTALVLLTASSLLGAAGCRRFPWFRHRVRAHRVVKGPQRLTPLDAASSNAKLAVPHFAEASLFVPVGARIARPIVLAIRGRGESPEQACNAWSAITNRDYFVLCPALGASADSPDNKPSCDSVECLADELREGLVALRKRFGRYVAPKEVMLAGRDTGAARAVPIALQNPAVFSMVWLVDGGLPEWSSAVASAYAERGGKFLGVACSSPACEAEASRVYASARMAGLTTAFIRAAPHAGAWSSELMDAVRVRWLTARPGRYPWSARR